jgi:hypothetical protein
MNLNMEILLVFFPLIALFNTVSASRPLDSTLSEDDGIEPRSLLRLWYWQSFAPTISARSHPQTARSHPQTARSHPQTVDLIHKRLDLIDKWLDLIHKR